MSKTVISVEHLSKRYELGVIGASTLQRDLKRWWARVRGRPDPTLKIGQEDLAKLKGEYIWALNDINLEVKQGDTLGIIGRNGAGKSTLLKVLSRVTAPTKGKVKVKGRITSLLEVGTGFHPELTGRENVYLNGAIFGMTRAEVDRKLEEIVDFSGVEKYIDTPVKRYSSGMYVRLAFAVAAHLDPEILIVDEVLAVGDLQFQKKCLGRMNDVAQEGRTVLFVSHSMDSVRKLCSRCILLDEGRIDQIGDSDRIIATYIKGATDNESISHWYHKPEDIRLDHKEFKPLELSLQSEDGTPVSSTVGSSEKVWVKIVGEITELHPNLVIGFNLYNSNRTLLFGSAQLDVIESKWPKLEQGVNSLRAPLPLGLLNAGTYRVELVSALHQMFWVIAPGEGPAVTFDLVIDYTDSPYSGYKKDGLIILTLPWESVK